MRRVYNYLAEFQIQKLDNLTGQIELKKSEF